MYGVENQRHSLKNRKHLYLHLGTVTSIVMLCCLSCGVLSSMKPVNMPITRQLIGCSGMETVCLIEDFSFRSVLEIPLGISFSFFLLYRTYSLPFFRREMSKLKTNRNGNF